MRESTLEIAEQPHAAERDARADGPRCIFTQEMAKNRSNLKLDRWLFFTLPL